MKCKACPYRCETTDELSELRQDAADALVAYLFLRESCSNLSKAINLAAVGYVTAQARYTLACAEANLGPILTGKAPSTTTSGEREGALGAGLEGD